MGWRFLITAGLRQLFLGAWTLWGQGRPAEKKNCFCRRRHFGHPGLWIRASGLQCWRQGCWGQATGTETSSLYQGREGGEYNHLLWWRSKAQLGARGGAGLNCKPWQKKVIKYGVMVVGLVIVGDVGGCSMGGSGFDVGTYSAIVQLQSGARRGRDAVCPRC